MSALRLGLGLAAAIAVASLPPVAMAQRVVPPGNSAVNQYTETFPTAGGGAPASDRGERSPAEVLGAGNAGRLEVLGPQGRAAAVLAAATAPSRSVAGKRAASGGGGGSRPRAGGPSGSSGLDEVIGQATGSSSSGQMGLLLPLVIVGAVVGSLAYLWRRKRQTE